MFFVAGAALSWGIYGPALQKGAHGLGHGPEVDLGRMKAFLCVGIAYFVMAVIYPIIMLAKDGKLGGFAGEHTTATVIATFSGVMGAAGALCVILAFGAGGSPVYVMPLIFGIAPVVNVAVTYLWDKAEGKSWTVPEWPFFAGIVLAGLGAMLVLMYKPAPAKPPAAAGKPAVAAAPSAEPGAAVK
jgi:hypothetical protein